MAMIPLKLLFWQHTGLAELDLIGHWSKEEEGNNIPRRTNAAALNGNWGASDTNRNVCAPEVDTQEAKKRGNGRNARGLD
jgi:hypothetical protein